MKAGVTPGFLVTYLIESLKLYIIARYKDEGTSALTSVAFLSTCPEHLMIVHNPSSQSLTYFPSKGKASYRSSGKDHHDQTCKVTLTPNWTSFEEIRQLNS
ncbi:hypothetical protein IPA_03835 [Ignicoccus pacificus DSM 13166]|uniref:Uncharacterized protein n=1 Tax=Ignicoccus pacificus DSM 13166 TaxID=940294 RepID=A0A977KB51_9CREN|nr:hypothetical protein IPA_03835 [Ignicoccus pacificus DSM 13166]